MPPRDAAHGAWCPASVAGKELPARVCQTDLTVPTLRLREARIKEYFSIANALCLQAINEQKIAKFLARAM
jgi:hypothetical protein